MFLKRMAFVLLLVVPASIIAQSTGAKLDSLIVVDGNNQPLPFVSVAVNGGYTRISNAAGVLLMHFDSDTLNVLVRRMGFDPFQGKIGRAANHGSFHVALANNSQRLKKVVVTERAENMTLARNGFYERMLEVQKGAPVGEFFTPDDLEARSPTKISQFLASSRFAKIGTYNGLGRFARPRAYIQGRASCPMSLLVDGVLIHKLLGDPRETDGSDPPIGRGNNSPFGEGRTSIDDVVTGAEVMAIEVYPSVANAPSSIASKVLGGACGIVAIWTGGR